MQTTLPVDAWLAEIVATVRGERRAVIVAPPGAGKTTRIPPALAEHGPTILLQPRRVAARALARRIAAERGWTVGEEIGWQIRFERRFGPRTRLLVATEGILTARLQSDPLLSDFAFVVLDEFHERSLHADLALALVRQAALSRDDLAVVVMSATIDAQPVAEFLGARVIEIASPRFPVERRYRAGMDVADAVSEAARDARGDVLCFLPGAREIARAEEALRGRVDAAVLPLHGALAVEAQEAALAPSSRRRIILATNVAETSLTVEGITDVVDTGLHKVLRYDAETAIDHLQTEMISTDSADQRAGRAGRTAPGRVTRLWDERLLLRPHREPEIQRVDLTSAVLDLIAWGGDPETFEWFEAPPPHRVSAALDLLRQLGAIDGRRITPLGAQIRRFPLHPRLARVLIDCRGAELAARVCALLSEDTRRLPRRSNPDTTPSDALSLATSPLLDPPAREIARIARDILGRDHRRDVSESALCRALLAGYADRVAVRREARSERLLLASGTGAALARESGVREGEFLVALEITGSTSQEPLVRMASLVEREWLEPTHRAVEHSIVNGRVRAVEKALYGAIVLRERNVDPDPEVRHRLVAAELEAGVDESLRRRIAFAGLEVDWSALAAMAAAAESRDPDLAAFLPYDVRRRLDQLAPERLPLPSGRTAALDYREDGSVLASAKLQELFGLPESPRLGPRKTPVTFALLSPAGRPVQITSDLHSFWNSGYQEVRKELRARYPKHPWPEDPWTAQPTHRTKKSR